MKKSLKDYKSKPFEALVKEEARLRDEMAKIRLKERAAASKDTNIVSRLKKSLAVVLTLKKEREQKEKGKKG